MHNQHETAFTPYFTFIMWWIPRWIRILNEKNNIW